MSGSIPAAHILSFQIRASTSRSVQRTANEKSLIARHISPVFTARLMALVDRDDWPESLSPQPPFQEVHTFGKFRFLPCLPRYARFLFRSTFHPDRTSDSPSPTRQRVSTAAFSVKAVSERDPVMVSHFHDQGRLLWTEPFDIAADGRLAHRAELSARFPRLKRLVAHVLFQRTLTQISDLLCFHNLPKIISAGCQSLQHDPDPRIHPRD